MYYYIEPEVAGELGENTKMDSSVHPPIVTKLHYVFNGWLGDQILESFPCFIVAEELKNKFEVSGLTGIVFDYVEISKSDDFYDMQPDTLLPNFFWLKVIGEPYKSDFSFAKDHRLVISDKACEIIKSAGVKFADIEECKV